MTEIQYSWGRLQNVKLSDRSVSQLQEYMDELGGCPYKFFLNRVVKAWNRPAAWLPQGSAVHTAAEFWERSGRTATRDEVEEAYRQAYRAETAALMVDTPNLNYWSPSWRYVGWEDITRRAFKGFGQLHNYLDYYIKHPEEVLWTTPDGQKALELKFRITLDKVRVQGYIDQVVGNGTFVVRDLKTGKSPGGTLQLKVYAVALDKEFGLEVKEGDYFLLDKKKPTSKYDLTQMSDEQVIDLFGRMNEGVRNEYFEPSPEPDKCRMCPFRQICDFAAE